MNINLSDEDTELVASRIADRVVKGDALVTAMKGVVKVGLNEFVESDEFSNAVGSIVENKVTGIVKTEVTTVFDNHMSDIKKMFATIGKALSDLGLEEQETQEEKE